MSADEDQRPPLQITKEELDRHQQHTVNALIHSPPPTQVYVQVDAKTLLRIISAARETLDRDKQLSEHDLIREMFGRPNEKSGFEVAARLEREVIDAQVKISLFSETVIDAIKTKSIQNLVYVLSQEPGSAFVMHLGDSYVAFYGKRVLDNGWEPYDQPDPRAYMPISFNECIRYDFGDSALLIHMAGRTIPSPPPVLDDEEDRLP